MRPTPFETSRDEYEIRFGRRTQSIAGRVLDSNGSAMSQVEVRIADPTSFGTTNLESLATHGEYATTNADGRFELGGLDDRSYTLSLVDRRTLRTGRPVSIPAGSKEAEIRFQSSDRTGRVAGRVVDESAAPVPGADVHLERTIVRSEGRNPETIDVSARADEKGAFEFSDVSTDVGSVCVAFPRDIALRHAFAAGEDLEHLVLVACKRAHFRLDLKGSAVEADSFRFLDSSGERAQVFKYSGSMSMSSWTGEIADGESEILAVTSAAETLILERWGAEVARISVHLAPGELTVLRP